MKARQSPAVRATIMMLTTSIIILVIALISINSGKMNLTPLEVWQVLIGQGTDQQNMIVYEFRLPRIVLAVIVGMGMGVSGCVMQTLLRNDMASPGTLGINSGTGLFVLIFVVIFSVQGVSSAIVLPLLAFVGGMTAAILIFVLAYRRGKDISPTSLILTGVALASGYSAFTIMLTLKLDHTQMDFMVRWFAGELWGDDWRYLRVLVPWTLILCLYVFYKSRVFNALKLGDSLGKGLGVAVKPEFMGLAVAAVALSSASVSLGGNFFFVGLIAPHISRRLVGHNHKFLVPTSCLTGAMIVLLADTISRTISFGVSIPTGILITILSTPYFLYLLSKAN